MHALTTIPTGYEAIFTGRMLSHIRLLCLAADAGYMNTDYIKVKLKQNTQRALTVPFLSPNQQHQSSEGKSPLPPRKNKSENNLQ